MAQSKGGDSNSQTDRKAVIISGLGPINLKSESREQDGPLGKEWCDIEMAQKLLDGIRDAYSNEKDGLFKSSLETLDLPTADAISSGARRALLVKYGLITNVQEVDVGAAWSNLLAHSDSGAVAEGSEQAASPMQAMRYDPPPPKHELVQLIQTSKSNGRALKWSIMDVMAGSKFQLHAHPNIELIYCLEGVLHEVRMFGAAVTTDFPQKAGDDEKHLGPDLTSIDRSWHFKTLPKGKWQANEVGSIHKSFTGSDMGTKLLVLWSEHAKITTDMEPKKFNVTASVEEMDRQWCCGEVDEGAVVNLVGDKFLPKSEK